MKNKITSILLKIAKISFEKNLCVDIHPSTCIRVYEIVDGEFCIHETVFISKKCQCCYKELEELLNIVSEYKKGDE